MIDENLSLINDTMAKMVGMNPNEALAHAVSALWYGYSVESFRAFIERVKAINMGTPYNHPSLPTSEGTLFDGMGFIPSEREKEDPEKTIKEINSRRICPVPFPVAYWKEIQLEYEEFEAQLLADVTSPAFLKLGEYLEVFL